jgi:hypothetical protein
LGSVVLADTVQVWRIEIFPLQFSAGATDRTGTALVLVLKLGGDRLQEFAANLRRQRPGRRR